MLKSNLVMSYPYKSENRIQQEMFMWHWNKYSHQRGLLFHIPNGGARSSREGKLFKDIGVIPGVADLCYLHDGVAYFIEVKNALGKQSTKQEKWEFRVRGEGFDYYIVRTLEEFQQIIQKINVF